MKKTTLIGFLIVLSSRLMAQAGSFDTTFNGTGRSSNCNNTLPYINQLNSSAFQSNGKIVSMGWNTTSCGISLVRFNSDGIIDNSFGTSGIIENTMCTVFNGNANHYPYQMAIQADDKIIIMGLQQSSVNKYWVTRLLPDGDLDISFNNTGYLELSFGTMQDRGYCVAIQPDGKILLGGNTGNTGEFMNVARLNSNGTLDTSFGINGATKVAFSAQESTPISIAVQPDGKIVLGGYTVTSYAQDFALTRFNSDGTLDTGFGTNGKVITTVDYTRSDRISKILIEPDGKIVAVGHTSDSSNPKAAMTRYLADGSLDASFGTNGIMISADTWGRYPSMARQIDGKYILTGGFDATTFEIYRYNHDGTIDSIFGNSGFVNGFLTTGGYGSSVLIQSDNKIVVVGVTSNSDFTQNCAAIVRLNPGVLSNEQFEINKDIIYPNPSTGIINFNLNSFNNAPFSVEVYNVMGQKVFEKQNVTKEITAISLSDLKEGSYFVYFTSENKILTKTIIFK